MLVVMVLLNAAVVLPALHQLWHDDHDCDQPDCVVLAMAQGKIDADPTPMPLVAWFAVSTPLVSPAMGHPEVASDCPPLPGRSPPV